MALPLAWPIAPLTKILVDAVHACDVARLADERYRESLTIADAASAYRRQTPCDWAAGLGQLAWARAGGQPSPCSRRDGQTARHTFWHAFYL